MATRLLRLAALGAPAMAIAALAQALTPPAVAVESMLARAQPGSGQVLAATLPTAAPAPPPTSTPARATLRPVAVRAAVRTPVPTPAPPPPPRSRLVSADGRLNTGVGVYGDCSGATEVAHTEAEIDTCITGRTYFVGHNPGVFTPLMSETVGSVVTWYDADGTAHVLRVVARRTWTRADGVPPMASDAVVAQFQTCLVADGSQDVVLDAVAA